MVGINEVFKFATNLGYNIVLPFNATRAAREAFTSNNDFRTIFDAKMKDELTSNPNYLAATGFAAIIALTVGLALGARAVYKKLRS